MKRVNRSFKRTSSFIHELTQKSFEKRGFSQSKVLTNWREIIGSDLFRISKPVKMSHSKRNLGATLIIEIAGVHGPELEMQKDIIIEKVNRVYGYLAVSKIRFISSAELGYGGFSDKSEKNKKKTFEPPSKVVEIDFQDILIQLRLVKNEKLRSVLNKFSTNFTKNQN